MVVPTASRGFTRVNRQVTAMPEPEICTVLGKQLWSFTVTCWDITANREFLEITAHNSNSNPNHSNSLPNQPKNLRYIVPHVLHHNLKSNYLELGLFIIKWFPTCWSVSCQRVSNNEKKLRSCLSLQKSIEFNANQVRINEDHTRMPWLIYIALALDPSYKKSLQSPNQAL